MNEKKENVNANEDKKCHAVEFLTRNQNLVVERKAFKSKDGRDLWSYGIFAKIRGRETKVDFQAYDDGGYEVLDMVFDIDSTAELVIREESMVNAETGELRKYFIYEVKNVDEDGDEFSSRVKLARDSDKSILNYLLKKFNSKFSNENN